MAFARPALVSDENAREVRAAAPAKGVQAPQQPAQRRFVSSLAATGCHDEVLNCQSTRSWVPHENGCAETSMGERFAGGSCRALGDIGNLVGPFNSRCNVGKENGKKPAAEKPERVQVGRTSTC